MRMFKGVSGCAAFFILISLMQPAYAVKPSLGERAFYQEMQKIGGVGEGATFANPWVDIDSIEVPPENKQATKLHKWLLQYRSDLETWPPRYSDDKEATALIKAWQKMKRDVEKWQDALTVTPELGALAVTFWVYGHNLDEKGAAGRAFALIDELSSRFGSHPLPPMMKGMLLSSTGGKGSHSFLKEAKARTGDKSLLGLIDFTIANQCSYSFLTHQSLLALNDAVDQCADCVRRYRELAHTIAEKAGSNPDVKLGTPYFLVEEKDGQLAGSRFYGFKARLPAGWNVDASSPYEPQNPVGAFMFNADPLPGSGLIHGVMFFTAIADNSRPEEPGAAFLRLFSKPGQGVKVSSIKPLAKNPDLTHWRRLDTEDRVGKNDTITMIAASGIFHPQTWTIADHRRGALEEGPCERPELEPKQMHILRLDSRIKAPVEFTLNYSASKASYAEAERKMKEIVATLKFDGHAFSEVEAKLAKELK